MNNCPKCNAPLPDMAEFCPHCMTQLIEKEYIAKPKIKKSKRIPIACACVSVILVIALIVSSCFYVYNKKHSPICTYDNFISAVSLASDRMEIDDLWDANNFLETHYFEEHKITQYNTDTYLGDANLSVFFYNEGEEVYAYFTDVSNDNFDEAESILKCITQAICNSYFKDIDEVFDNEIIYPKRTLSDPFDPFFTDLLSRTDKYNNDIKNGASISTKYIPMSPIESKEIVIFYYIVERNYQDETIYDLAVDIERLSNAQ